MIKNNILFIAKTNKTKTDGFKERRLVENYGDIYIGEIVSTMPSRERLEITLLDHDEANAPLVLWTGIRVNLPRQCHATCKL